MNVKFQFELCNIKIMTQLLLFWAEMTATAANTSKY